VVTTLNKPLSKPGEAIQTATPKANQTSINPEAPKMTTQLAKIILVTLFTLSTATHLLAVEKFNFTTRDGIEIKDATFSRRTPDGVAFMSDSGVSKIRFEMLPTNLQKRFRYDPDEAQAFRERKEMVAEAKRKAARDAELKRREERDRERLLPKLDLTVSGRVLQVLPDGVLLSGSKATRPGTEPRSRQVQTDGPTTLSPHRKRTYRTVVDVVETTVPVDIGSGTVMLVDKALAETALDGQYFSAQVYSIGRFQYTDKVGNDRTVARFTPDADTAIAYGEEQIAKAKAARDAE